MKYNINEKFMQIVKLFNYFFGNELNFIKLYIFDYSISLGLV